MRREGYLRNLHQQARYTGSGPRAVILQTCEEEALHPESIVVAYKENGSVTFVVSDFDCFTLGARGVAFESPPPLGSSKALEMAHPENRDNPR